MEVAPRRSELAGGGVLGAARAPRVPVVAFELVVEVERDRDAVRPRLVGLSPQ